jgi:hypothetical protein
MAYQELKDINTLQTFKFDYLFNSEEIEMDEE